MHRAQRWYDATDKARSYTLVGNWVKTISYNANSQNTVEVLLFVGY